MKTAKLQKINFKKVFIIYLVAALVVGIVSAVTLGVVFKDKISLAMEYRKISEACDDGFSAADQKDKLTAFAKSSEDVADVLILDKDNKIIFTVKNADIIKNEVLNLEPVTVHNNLWRGYRDEERGYLTDPTQPGVFYRILDGDFPNSLKTLMLGWSAHDDFEEEHFYESGTKTVYSLRYIADEKTGEKVYIIFDIKPIVNSAVYLKVVAAIAMLFFMLYWVLVALAVYSNAEKSKLRGAAWGILTLFTNLTGALIYLIYKQVNQTCYQCHAVQSRDNAYCTACGTKLAGACPKCEGSTTKSNDYCGHCGEKLK